MSLNNKMKDMTPFNMQEKPCRQNILLLPLIWGLSFLSTRKFKLKIKKLNMKGVKPPYLVISTHQGPADYSIAPLSLFPHRANYVSDMEGFAAFGKGLYRAIGCIGKRRFVSDVSVLKNVSHVLKKQHAILVLFPESRHSNVGTTALLPNNLGKLCKFLEAPVVTLTVHGSYLANPFWDESNCRKVRMEATLSSLCTSEMLSKYSADELQKMISERLFYDEYAWQKAENIKICEEKRAEGLHFPLYQCKNCRSESSMKSRGAVLFCEACGTKYMLKENGDLASESDQVTIPDWYEWERKNVISDIESGIYSGEFSVSVEALPNEKGFVLLGNAKLLHTYEGFQLEMEDKKLFFSSKTLESVQTEYNYRGRGPCIVLSTRNCCYYLYSTEVSFHPTKLQFAAEYLHKKINKDRKLLESLQSYI